MTNVRHSAQTFAVGVICLLLAGCGGSKHSAPASTTATTSSTSTSTTAASSTSAQQTPASSQSSPAQATSTAASSSSRSPGGSTNVRVPATFVIRTGGRLVPASVSAPAFLAVQLSVVAVDGRPHRVVLKTPVPHVLNVPVRGRAAVLVPGLRAGQYEIDVDGAARGMLLIGGEPGP